MFTDNKDFYPTPKHLYDKLTGGVRYFASPILEPSAGSGDMIRYIKNRRNDYQIDAIENDMRLVSQLYSDNINVVWNDFLTYETFKEYGTIIMNPPFSNGVEHALKAIDLAENQLSSCEIFIILNKETLNNAYSNKRQDLLRKLDRYNAKIEYVKDGFTSADRKTDVEVALIHVKVVPADESKSVYEDIVGNLRGGGGRASDKTEEVLSTALSTYVKHHEVQEKMNDIERMIIEYETACKYTVEAHEAFQRRNQFVSYINEANKTIEEEREQRRAEAAGKEIEKQFKSGKFSTVITTRYTSEDLNNELEKLRRGYWELILQTDEFRAQLTNEASVKLNRQLEATADLEINLTNIQMLLTAIQTNHHEMLSSSVVNMFTRITKYHMNSYSTNIHYYDGWKTNDAYKINHKIIIPISHMFDSWDFKDDYSRITFDVRNYIDDLVKAFQLFDNTITNDFNTISNREFENELLRFRMFNNGNIHVWFKDRALLNKLNYFCGQHFNWIPSDGEQQESEEAREYVAKEFGNVGEVKLLSVGA